MSGHSPGPEDPPAGNGTATNQPRPRAGEHIQEALNPSISEPVLRAPCPNFGCSVPESAARIAQRFRCAPFRRRSAGVRPSRRRARLATLLPRSVALERLIGEMVRKSRIGHFAASLLAPGFTDELRRFAHGLLCIAMFGRRCGLLSLGLQLVIGRFLFALFLCDKSRPFRLARQRLRRGQSR